MDPYNLAICFGPTLVPVPEDKDQVQYQNLVNELIKNIIVNSEDIFPNDGGLLYERYISKEPDEGYLYHSHSSSALPVTNSFLVDIKKTKKKNREVGEAPSDTMSEEIDSEVYPSEDGKLSYLLFVFVLSLFLLGVPLFIF